jgi:hypothetical protein
MPSPHARRSTGLGHEVAVVADPLVALFELGNGRTEKLTMFLSSDGSRLAVTEQSSLRGTHEYLFHR